MSKIAIASILGMATLVLGVFPLFAQEEEPYQPGNTPYIGVAIGSARYSCKDSQFRQLLHYLPVDESGMTQAPGDGTSVLQTDGTVQLSGGCRSDKAYQVYGGVDFHIQSAGMPILLGVELGWIDLGRTRQDNVTYPTSFLNLENIEQRVELLASPIEKYEHSATTIYYGARLGYRVLDNRLLLYAKGGLHSWEYQREFGLRTVTSQNVNNSDNMVVSTQVIAPSPLSNRGAQGATPLVYRDRDVFYGLGIQYDVPYEKGVIGLRAEWTRFEFDQGPIDLTVNLYSLGISYHFNI